MTAHRRAGSAAPVFSGQRLATIVTTQARACGKTVADYPLVKKNSRTGNFVRVHINSDLIRPLNEIEMACALNLPPFYAFNTNASEEKKRKFLGSTFGKRTIDRILGCFRPLLT